MNHRHLLPDEIDLLLDGEEGFGVAPLRNHLQSCPSCQAEYNALAAVVAGMEAMPLIAPSPLFTQKVMSQVQVFEPWHVALRENLRRWMPQSSVGRVFAGATGGVMAVALTMLGIWLGQRADAVLFLANLVLQRTRESLGTVVSSIAHALLGDTAASAVLTGGPAATLAVGGTVLVSILIAAFGVKSLATAGRRRRS